MRVERNPKTITQVILLTVAVVAATTIAAMAAGPVMAQGSGADQYCSLNATQADQYRGCDEDEVIILPLPEPIDEIPEQPNLEVEVPSGEVVNVEVAGVIDLIGDGSEIAVQPAAVNFVSEAVAEDTVAKDVVVEGAAADISDTGETETTASGSADVDGADSEGVSVETLPDTSGPSIWLAALPGSGIVATMFVILLFCRGVFGR